MLDVLRNLVANPERPLERGLAITEGRTAVLQLMRSGRLVHGIVGDPALVPNPTVALNRSELATLLGFDLRSPVVAVAEARDDDALSLTYPIVALDGIHDATNVGAIMRTVAALGIPSVLRDSRSTSPWLRRSVRASMGACFFVRSAAVDDLAAYLADQRAEGRVVVGLETGPGTIPLGDCPRPDILVVGNEGHGLRPSVRAVCNSLAAIPMALPHTSLNVVQASAIGMWELWTR